jgi:oxygen-independent coproporphyrinogen III oxidase
MTVQSQEALSTPMSVDEEGGRTQSLEDHRSVDPHLLAKYDVRGPRYTSYPPAPHFAPVALDALMARWSERNGLDPDPGLSVYVHVPFCAKRCAFCGCHTIGPPGPGMVDGWLGALLAEMDLALAVVDRRRPVRQLALGGGTPNFLDVSRIDRLLSGIEGRFALQDDAERSVEMDPRVATPGRVAAFLDHGFNRFSLGIQDFDDQVLSFVGRPQPLRKVTEVVAQLHAAGCEAVNFDLIYGLPGQTPESARATAARVLGFRPSRIAVYGYAHVPWMRPHQAALEPFGIPGSEQKAAIGLAFADALLEGGYVQVGMDHFALPDDPLVQALKRRTLRRTFMGYTTGRGLDNLGFGPSSISWVGSSYSQDEKELASWMAAVSEGRLPIVRGHLLSRDDLLRQDLLLELFCTFRADLDALSARHGVDAVRWLADDLSRLAPLEEDGLVRFDGHTIQVPEAGHFFVRNVCMVFDRYLEHDLGERRYSRTV